MSEEERIEILNFACSIYGTTLVLPLRRRQYVLDRRNLLIPKCLWDVRERIVEREGLQGYKPEIFLSDFMAFILPGGELHRHTDPNQGDLIHTRFNVMILLPKIGGQAFYGGVPVEAEQGHYVLSRSGMDEHWATINEDTVPRITLSFGFLLPKEKIYALWNPPEELQRLDFLHYQYPPEHIARNNIEQTAEEAIAEKKSGKTQDLESKLPASSALLAQPSGRSTQTRHPPAPSPVALQHDAPP